MFLQACFLFFFPEDDLAFLKLKSSAIFKQTVPFQLSVGFFVFVVLLVFCQKYDKTYYMSWKSTEKVLTFSIKLQSPISTIKKCEGPLTIGTAENGCALSFNKT